MENIVEKMVEEVLSLVRNPYLTNNNGLEEVENTDRLDEHFNDRKKITRTLRKALTEAHQAGRDEAVENKRKILEEFAEYAHTRYNGCVNDGEFQYQYDTEVVCMIDDYLDIIKALQDNK